MSNTFIAQVEKDLIALIRKDISKTSRDIDNISQTTIEDFEAVDSGLMQQKTFTRFQVGLPNDVIAEATFKTRGLDYPIFVVEGRGGNKKYGKRNYLETARDQTLEQIKTGTYKRIFKKGGQNKGLRKFNKRI